ncbi:MAG: AI-2E family transporter [Candidatus Cyclobacteriaceae bacterium M3_2C_046]
MDKKLKILLYTFLILGSLYFLFVGLAGGKVFLIPLVTAIVLSMMMNPVAHKLMHWGLSRGLAVFLSDLIIVLFIAVMVFLFAAQANKIADSWSQIEDRMQPKIEQVRQFVQNKFNVSLPTFQSGSQNQSSSPATASQGETPSGSTSQDTTSNQNNNPQSSDISRGGQPTSGSGQAFSLSSLRSTLTQLLSRIFGILSDLLLILVYIFFFMFYQQKFEQAIVGFVPEGKKDQAKQIIRSSAKSAQQYLFGRFILILVLATLYTLGYSIIGLKYALFISLIAALFSMVPYVGNVIGLFLALAMSFLSGGSVTQLLIIMGIFAVVQFIESYVLEPFVVGGKVDLNPVIVIVGVVLAGIVWGIMGMLLAIPVLGILKVVFDSITVLKPLGYVLDERGISSGNQSIQKIKGWFKNKVD